MSDGNDLRALDPALSVIVEACAGSGKTWTLVSRLIRLLLAGVQPGEILAITYTRKAAREIEERLQHWLANLAVWDEERVAAFLGERGLDARRDPALIDRARGLFEHVATARPGLTVNTFHGWFSALLAAAPLSSGLSGQQLAERTAQLRDQAWAVLMRRAGSAPEGELAQSVRWLLAQCGIAGTQKLAGVLIDRRAEWQAWLDAHGDLEGVLAHLRDFFGADAEGPVDALARDPALRSNCLEFARLLGQGTDAQQRRAAALEQACGMTDAQAFFDGVRAAVLKSDGQPIAFKPGKALESWALPMRRRQRSNALHRLHCAVSVRALRSRCLDPQRSRPARGVRIARCV
jgi:ATP-dependent helicase/nuclease subunit A